MGGWFNALAFVLLGCEGQLPCGPLSISSRRKYMCLYLIIVPITAFNWAILYRRSVVQLAKPRFPHSHLSPAQQVRVRLTSFVRRLLLLGVLWMHAGGFVVLGLFRKSSCPSVRACVSVSLALLDNFVIAKMHMSKSVLPGEVRSYAVTHGVNSVWAKKKIR